MWSQSPANVVKIHWPDNTNGWGEEYGASEVAIETGVIRGCRACNSDCRNYLVENWFFMTAELSLWRIVFRNLFPRLLSQNSIWRLVFCNVIERVIFLKLCSPSIWTFDTLSTTLYPSHMERSLRKIIGKSPSPYPQSRFCLPRIFFWVHVLPFRAFSRCL